MARSSAKCTRSTVLGMELTFSDIQSTFLGGGIKKSAFCSRELIRSSLGRLSVFARWSKARYKKGKRNGNLNK